VPHQQNLHDSKPNVNQKIFCLFPKMNKLLIIFEKHGASNIIIGFAQLIERFASMLNSVRASLRGTRFVGLNAMCPLVNFCDEKFGIKHLC
jgi:hypothetical protein